MLAMEAGVCPASNIRVEARLYEVYGDREDWRNLICGSVAWVAAMAAKSRVGSWPESKAVLKLMRCCSGLGLVIRTSSMYVFAEDIPWRLVR